MENFMKSFEKLTENEKIGFFLLKLYHRSLFGYKTEGLIEKSVIRKEFQHFCRRNNFKYYDKTPVGTLLRRNGFLMNTPKESKQFKILLKKFFEFRNKLLNRFDEEQINLFENSFKSSSLTESKIEQLMVDPEFDEVQLSYEKSTQQNKIQNFLATNKSCVVCQLSNFTKESDYDDHIKFHGYDSEFESLNSYTKYARSYFKISYQACLDSFYLRFTLESTEKDLIIEHIIAILSNSMISVKKDETPYRMPSDGIDYFYIDRHNFPSGIEHPIIVIFQKKRDGLLRRVEQHHLLTCDDFPEVSLKIRSSSLLGRSELASKKLKKNYIPDDRIKRLHSEEFPNHKLMGLNSGILSYLENGKNFNPQNIAGALRTMLQIEDLENMLKVEKLNQSDAEIKKRGKDFIIKLKNIPTEITPEEVLSPYDELVLINDQKGNNIRYYCTIYKIYGNNVCFYQKNENKGRIIENEKYNIKFSTSRLNIIFQHMALDFLEEEPNLIEILFPKITQFQRFTKLNLEYFNESLTTNFEQLEAVENIVRSDYNNKIPFILSGPPGTGKTTVIAESILQIRKNFPNSRVLICSASNAAVDELTRKLLEFQVDSETNSVLRIYSSNVAEKRYNNIEQLLLDNSNLCYGEHFYPSVESILNYPVICCTLSVLGRYIHHGKMNRGYFTHCFIDECGAITELEALIAITGVLYSQTKLVLSGDVKQLGPIIQSGIAKELGLGISLMERLLKRDCYKVDEQTKWFDRQIQSRLLKNYRSHPSILNTFNTLFYDSELIPQAPKDLTHIALNWYNLPSLKFPLIFNVVYGKCCKSFGSTSSYNLRELSVVIHYIKELMYFGINDRKINEEDIGIISPYKKQCSLIREELDKRHWHKIEAGAVETFQGRQKSIIIVTLVRSFSKNIEFISCPKRMNVLLSRAQSLLIIIGNPKTIGKIPNFEKVINYCLENNALTGAKYNNDNNLDSSKKSDSLSSLSTISSDFQKISLNHNDEKKVGAYVKSNKTSDYVKLAAKVNQIAKPNNSFKPNYNTSDYVKLVANANQSSISNKINFNEMETASMIADEKYFETWLSDTRKYISNNITKAGRDSHCGEPFVSNSRNTSNSWNITSQNSHFGESTSNFRNPSTNNTQNLYQCGESSGPNRRNIYPTLTSELNKMNSNSTASNNKLPKLNNDQQQTTMSVNYIRRQNNLQFSPIASQSQIPIIEPKKKKSGCIVS